LKKGLFAQCRRYVQGFIVVISSICLLLSFLHALAAELTFVVNEEPQFSKHPSEQFIKNMIKADIITQGQAGIFEPSYRRNFILKICVGFLLIAFVCAAAFYLYFDRAFTGNYVGVLATLEKMQREICYGVMLSVLVQVLFFTLLIFLVSVVWTHKIAGPLYRLRLSFLQIATGNLAIVTRFRDTDQLQNIPVLLNSGLQQLRTDFDEIDREIFAVRGEIERLTAESSGQDASEIVLRLQGCERQLGKILERMKS